MIDGLHKEHIGQIVVFVGKNSDGTIYHKELGVIKSYRNDNRIAWVVYSCASKWMEYGNYTGVSTCYDNIVLTNVNIKTVE